MKIGHNAVVNRLRELHVFIRAGTKRHTVVLSQAGDEWAIFQIYYLF